MTEEEFIIKLYLLGFVSLNNKLIGMSHRLYFKHLTVIIYTNNSIRYTYKGLYVIPINKDKELTLSIILKKLKEIT